ncbi:MAG: MFS transporter [Nitriliruptoraceae bacterium]|nr:MFS transporter [Nitriliruptoraceae bacterium]
MTGPTDDGPDDDQRPGGPARPQGRSPAAILGIASGSTIGSNLPMFLVGALATQLSADLGFGAAGIGLAVAAFRAATTVTTLFLGPLTDRIGSSASLRIAMTITIVTCIGLTGFTSSLRGVVAWMAIGGIATALSQPAANRLVVVAVPAHLQGIAFGIKQGSLPAATMLAGLSVPFVALTLGWRWAFGSAGVLAFLVMLAIGRRPAAVRAAASQPRARPVARRYRTYVVFTVAFVFAASANSTIPSFYVDAAVAAGGAADTAGFVLAAASIGAVITRVATGMLCDRLSSGHFRVCAAMIAVGGLGLMLTATGSPVAMAVGTIIGLSGTWGFTAVFWFALMRTYPDNPGSVTGAVAPGSHLGGTIGPLVFGLVAQTGSYDIAWILAGSMAFISAAIMLRATSVAARG